MSNDVKRGEQVQLAGRRIAIGVGGGIAAYKVCELVRLLRKAGAEVRVALTPAAAEFVTPLSLQSLSGHPVLTRPFDPKEEAGFGHLSLARWAELFLVAPATADLIARIRAGMANDGVTSALLAYRGPVVVAPAMNTAMWEHQETTQNVAALRKQARYHFVGPNHGALADGDVGMGRLAELDEIIAATNQIWSTLPLAGRRVLITAGPTREFFDPVRFISNPSSGKMGLALAAEARSLGAAVTVVLGPTREPTPPGVEIVRVVSAVEMSRAVMRALPRADFFIAAAAVSDYRPRQISKQKLKKGDGAERVELVRTVDVLRSAAEAVRAKKRRPILVGFAAETQDVLENARAKLATKQLDAIVANDVSDRSIGFEANQNRVTVLRPGKKAKACAGTKAEVAAAIWQTVMEISP